MPLAPARALAGSISLWSVLLPLVGNRWYSPSESGQSLLGIRCWVGEEEEEGGAIREWTGVLTHGSRVMVTNIAIYRSRNCHLCLNILFYVASGSGPVSPTLLFGPVSVSESPRRLRRRSTSGASTHDQNASEADDEEENISADVTQSLTTSQYLRRVQSNAVPSLAMVTPVLAELSVFADVPLDVPTFSQTQGQAQNMKKHLFDETLMTPQAAAIGRQIPCSSRGSPTSQYESSSQERTIARTANKGKQKGVYDRSSAEVEQLLPVHDPRNLYASDSPVIEDLDSDEELYKSAEEVAENIDPDGQSDGAANKTFVFTGAMFASGEFLGTSSKSR
ncbi:hypothetical protein EDB84DRAFT_1446147 [Lactarius hengduanensis]|nr:hypothetical protein EDB84DRAFT_1446147 [Lactarius hengduanensis]